VVSGVVLAIPRGVEAQPIGIELDPVATVANFRVIV
jgi:hypothetical protein